MNESHSLARRYLTRHCLSNLDRNGNFADFITSPLLPGWQVSERTIQPFRGELPTLGLGLSTGGERKETQGSFTIGCPGTAEAIIFPYFPSGRRGPKKRWVGNLGTYRCLRTTDRGERGKEGVELTSMSGTTCKVPSVPPHLVPDVTLMTNYLCA